jgi:hypothetical protein
MIAVSPVNHGGRRWPLNCGNEDRCRSGTATTFLGGKGNFIADRDLAEETIAVYPNIVFSVRANRAFLACTVRFLVSDCGIRQFLDIGTGIPTANNTHEGAQRLEPSSRIVYVDNDRMLRAVPAPLWA